MAYCLPALDSCSARYCFGETGECNATSESVSSATFVQSTTLSKLTKTSTQRTTLPQYSVSESTGNTDQSTTLTQPTSNTDQSTTSKQPTSSTDQSTTSKQPTINTYKSTTSTQSTISGQSVTSTQFSISSSAPGKWTSSAAQTSNVPTTTSSLNEQCMHDPCDPRYIENIPNLVNRSNECIYDSTLRPCDLDIKSVWYTGFHLLNKCPDFLRCGAVYPVWMNGSEPAVKDGIVTRQACKVASNECCAEKFEIQVVNCRLFTAYCLTPLRLCEERYCFDTKTCSTKPKKQETSVDVPGDASSTTYIVLAVVAAIIIISIVTFFLLFRYMRRNQTDETYEIPKPAPAQPENPYEMPVISDVNHGNVYDELPSKQEDTDDQTVVDEEHYVTV